MTLLKSFTSSSIIFRRPRLVGFAFRPLATTSRLFASADAPSPQLKKALGSMTDNDRQADQFFHRGVEQFNAGDVSGAKTSFQKAVDLKPSSDSLYNLGNMLYLSKDFNGAIKTWEESLKYTTSPLADVHVNLANLYALYVKDYQNAIRHYEAARRITPHDVQVLFNLACAFDMSGELEKAIELYKQCSDQGIPQAKQQLRNALAKLASKEK